MQEQGYCACGCGKRTWVATKNDPRLGWVKGQSVTYARGHASRLTGPDYEVAADTGCWRWLKTIKNDVGYGVLMIDGRQHYAHRVYFERHLGPIPDGLQIDHLCRNRLCVNPEHLEAVTLEENLRRGESPSAVNRRKVFCPKGHALDGDNLYVAPKSGRRDCLMCRRQRTRDWRAKSLHPTSRP